MPISRKRKGEVMLKYICDRDPFPYYIILECIGIYTQYNILYIGKSLPDFTRQNNNNYNRFTGYIFIIYGQTRFHNIGTYYTPGH